MTMFRKMLATLLCAALATTGCASASGRRVAQAAPAPVQDSAVLADYVQRLAAGSKVRVERSNGDVLRGTLIKATAESIVVQKNTRVPERPVEVPLSEVTRVSLDAGGSSAGRTIGIGAASGAAGALAFFLVLLAMFGGG
jgi:hypothetical protein